MLNNILLHKPLYAVAGSETLGKQLTGDADPALQLVQSNLSNDASGGLDTAHNTHQVC